MQTFLPSPRNSQVAHISLLSRLECTRLVVTTPELPCVSLISEKRAVEILHIPSLAQLLDSKDIRNYPYSKPFEEAKNDPIFVLHTSGSTGMLSIRNIVTYLIKRYLGIPKPLQYTNSFVAGIAINTSLEPPDGFQSLDRYFRMGNFFMTLPSFHVSLPL